MLISMTALASLVQAQHPPTSGDRHKHVWILHSYHKGYPLTDREEAGIESVLAPEDHWIERHIDYMDAKRNNTPAHIGMLRQMVALRYEPGLFDAIMAVDNDALNFVLAYRETLFPGVPVVFCGINNFEKSMLDGHRGYTGVLDSVEYEATVRLAVELRPGTRHIVVISDRTTTGLAHENAMRKVEPRLQNLVSIEYLSLGSLSMNELLAKIRGLNNDTAVLLLSHVMDREGIIYTQSESMRLICGASAAPVYTISDFRVGAGAVGGKVISGVNQGHTAARMLIRVLRGESPESMPIETYNSNQFLFDHRQLTKWNIAELQLPPGSVVLNRPESFLHRHRNLVLATLSIIVLLIMVIAALVVNIFRRRTIEQEMDHINADLKQKNAQLEQFIYTISHDLKSPLVTINGFIGHMKQTAFTGQLDRHNQYAERVRGAADHMRRLIDDLLSLGRIGRVTEPPSLIRMNELIQALLNNYQIEIQNKTVQVSVQPQMPDIRADRNRVTQIFDNLLINALTHGCTGSPPRISIGGTVEGNMAIYFVRDNGPGIAPEYHTNVFQIFRRLNPNSPGTGVGLTIVKQAAESLGGSARVESQPGQGATLRITLPLSPAQPQARQKRAPESKVTVGAS